MKTAVAVPSVNSGLSPVRTRWQPTGALAIGSLLYVAVLALWFCSQPMPALQDFQEWVFQGWAMARLVQGDASVHAQFAASFFPVPNLLSQCVLTALSLVAGPFLAAKVLIGAYCLGATWICWAAARRFTPQFVPSTFALLLALTAFNSCFWHGYINYQIGLMLILLFLERTDARRPSPIFVLGYSALLYACHGSMLIVFVLLVAAREWRRPDRLKVLVALVPFSALFSFYVLSRSHAGQGKNNPAGTLLKHVAYKAYTVAKVGPFQNLVGPSGTSAAVTPLLYRAGVALNLLFALVLIGALLFGLYRWWQSRTLPVWLLWFWGALVGLFLLMPADIAEVVNLGERFLYVLLASMVLFLPRIWSRAALGWMCVAGFALTLAQLPRVSLHGTGAPEAFHRAPEADGRAYRGDGLFSHRLYQNDERRTELRDRATQFTPLLFDTSMLRQRDGAVVRDAGGRD